MDHEPQLSQDQLRKLIHDLNNRIGVILNVAELLQLEPLPPKVADRAKLIELKAVEARDLIRAFTARATE